MKITLKQCAICGRALPKYKITNYCENCDRISSVEEKITSKEQARKYAIDWQTYQAEQSMSWQEVAEWSDFFTKLGKKYGLLKEFKENGII